MSGPTVLVGAFAHETNTFVSALTGVEEFERYRVFTGEEIGENLAGTNTEIGGIISVAEREGVELLPTVAAKAEPGGRVTRAAYDRYTSLITGGIRGNEDDIDGVVLSLHGAMAPEGMDDGEGPLLSDVRDLVGESTPVVGTLDLHANVTEAMVEHTDALIAYRTYPHVDMAETGERGMELLIETIEGETTPTMHAEQPPMLAYVPKQNTLEGPMATVMERASALEDRESVLAVNVVPGFYQTDTTSVAFSIVVVTDNESDLARGTARELGSTVWGMRREFVEDYPDPTEGVARAADAVADGETEDGPVVLADMGDNPGGGGAADGTTVLRALLGRGVEDAGLAIVRDPDVVEECIGAGVGSEVTVDLGGKTDDRHGAPIESLGGYVKAITDGTFVNRGPMKRGAKHHLGRTVRLQCGSNGVDVIVTENRLQPMDAEIWRHVGVQPERLDVLAVKSTNHYRADYEPMASRVIPVDSIGLSAIDPANFEYTRLPRPVFPVDDLADGAYP